MVRISRKLRKYAKFAPFFINSPTENCSKLLENGVFSQFRCEIWIQQCLIVLKIFFLGSNGAKLRFLWPIFENMSFKKNAHFCDFR